MEKMTKRDYFELLKTLVIGHENEEELTEFLDKQILMIDTKAEKAKARAAEKKADGDELRNVVESVLTEEPQRIVEIASKIDGEDVTKAKITARLTQLVKAGIAEKIDVKDPETNKTVKAYKLA